jgi:hypothetical protein
VTGDKLRDEEIVRNLPADALVTLSERQRAAIDGVLARLEAAEKVCAMVGDSLSPKRRAATKDKKLYWWDVAGAVSDWEKLAKQ